MATLKEAMPTIILQEGRKANNKNDPGGYTDYGISLQFLLQTGDLDKDGWQDGDINHDGVINSEDIKSLDPDKASHLYDLYWWSKYGYETIQDQGIATKLLSLAINMGNLYAHKCLQRAVRAATGIILVDDGIIGNKTFTAVEMCDPKILLSAFKSEAAGYYRSIRFKDPNKDPNVFLKGWLNRAYSDMVK